MAPLWLFPIVLWLGVLDAQGSSSTPIFWPKHWISGGHLTLLQYSIVPPGQLDIGYSNLAWLNQGILSTQMYKRQMGPSLGPLPLQLALFQRSQTMHSTTQLPPSLKYFQILVVGCWVVISRLQDIMCLVTWLWVPIFVSIGLRVFLVTIQFIRKCIV